MDTAVPPIKEEVAEVVQEVAEHFVEMPRFQAQPALCSAPWSLFPMFQGFRRRSWEVVKGTPHESSSERSRDQTVEIPVPRRMEDIMGGYHETSAASLAEAKEEGEAKEQGWWWR